MKTTKLSLFFLLMIVACHLQAQQPAVIAHRGYWKIAGSAQNSLLALVKADSIGCYGSEFDVWLTKDHQLVVNHDPLFKLRSMERSKASKLTQLTLDNGENLPTLKQYLNTGKGLQTKLILELKAHSKPERETKAVKKIIALVKSMHLESRMEYITFSQHALKEFIRLAPQGTPVFYLGGDLTPEELKAWGCAGADYHLGVFRKHPEWISQLHQLGLKVNVWTVNKEEDMTWLIQQKVDFITTNEPVLLQSLLK